MKVFIPFLVLFNIAVLGCMAQDGRSTFLLDSNIQISGNVQTFVPADHKLDTCDSEFDWTAICLIDGLPVYGPEHFEMPRNQLTDLQITIDNIATPLDVDGIFNPSWKNTLRADQFKISNYMPGYYRLVGTFSDGAGGYFVVWHIINGKSFKVSMARCC